MAKRKRAAKAATRTPRESHIDDDTMVSSSTANKPAGRKFIVPLIVLVILGLLYAFRGAFISATVNGQPIGRLTIVRELEKQSGKRVLESLVTKTIILQEAKKKNITVSDKDIEGQIKKIETNIKAQGMTLDQALQSQGMTRASLKDEMKLQLMVQKLVGNSAAVSDKEVAAYREQNKAMYETNPDKAPTDAQIKEQLTQQKIQQKTQDYVAKLRKDAKVAYYTSY